MSRPDKFKFIHSEIIIHASAEHVWSLLTDLDGWSSWNPFIIKSEGRAVAGTRIRNTMKSNGKTYVFKPKVLKADKPREFKWVGHMFFPGLFDGTHSFQIEELGEGKVKLIQSESFKGILSKSILKKIYEETATNFRKMNEALKARAEQ